MRATHLVAALAASIVLSTTIGFAAAKLTEPEMSRAAKDPSVALLKKIQGNTSEAANSLNAIETATSANSSKLDAANARLTDVYGAIGESEFRQGTVRGLLKRICSETAGPATSC